MKNHKNIVKSFFSIMFVGLIAFSTIFTLNGEKVYAETDTAQCWEIIDIVDDFGDGTGENCIKSAVTGIFSNTATSDSDLTVIVFINNTDSGEYIVEFRLLEYNETSATHFSSDDMILKTKVDDEIIEYRLFGGENSNSDIYIIPLSFSRIDQGRDGELLVKELYEGNDVRCIIEMGSSKYTFTLEAGNLKKIIDENREGKPLDITGQEEREEAYQVVREAAQEAAQEAEKAAKEAEEEEKAAQEAEKQRLLLEKAESVIKSKTDFIAAYVNHVDVDNGYESGYYYFKGHADEFEDLTEEELLAIFPCRFRYYLVNPVLAGTTGAGELYEYDAEGNTKLLGSYGLDDSYRTREEINPNWLEINGSWRIENGELIRTATSTKAESEYKVKSLDHDGYYLLCGASGNGPAMMIVLYDENNMPLHEFTEE